MTPKIIHLVRIALVDSKPYLMTPVSIKAKINTYTVWLVKIYEKSQFKSIMLHLYLYIVNCYIKWTRTVLKIDIFDMNIEYTDKKCISFYTCIIKLFLYNVAYNYILFLKCIRIVSMIVTTNSLSWNSLIGSICYSVIYWLNYHILSFSLFQAKTQKTQTEWRCGE